MNGRTLDNLVERLCQRDFKILADIERFRLLTTRQVQRLHFASDHLNASAATRATARALFRLRQLSLISVLDRRIGGVRRGSASYVWQLGPAGDRLLRRMKGEPQRRRFVEPSHRFVNHTLAIVEVAVLLIETERAKPGFAITNLETEPSNWLTFLGRNGVVEWLKPDLHLVTTTDEFENHQFIEVDLGSEHMPQIVAKCHTYQRYATTGAYQAEHGLFPAVLWLSDKPPRLATIAAAIAGDANLRPGLFQIRSPDEFIETLVNS